MRPQPQFEHRDVVGRLVVVVGEGIVGPFDDPVYELGPQVGDPLRYLVPAQRDAVEKTQRADRLIERRPGNPLRDKLESVWKPSLEGIWAPRDLDRRVAGKARTASFCHSYLAPVTARYAEGGCSGSFQTVSKDARKNDCFIVGFLVRWCNSSPGGNHFLGCSGLPSMHR